MEIIKIESSKNSYLQQSKIKAQAYQAKQEKEIINIYPKHEKQELLGFGGAITEASSYCYSLLPDSKKHAFLKDYFDNNYSIGRLCIGSSDFSMKSYSYATKKDLSDFNIQHDRIHIIPLIKDALKMNPRLKWIASPWSPPAFMKTNKILALGGHLSENYYSLYAEYLSKYILAYQEEGISIDYITIQNETSAIQIWESCLYSPEQEAKFVTNFLAPAFEKYHISTRILIHDHNKEKLFWKANIEFASPQTRNLIAGMAFHWYSGDHYENIELVRKYYPEKLLIHTEGCFGYQKEECNYHYAQDIMDDFNAGANAYIDWNILLDAKGGPNHVKNYCMAPILLNKENDDYIKSLNYYYIQHFSKFIQPNAKVIAHSKYSRNISVLSCKNPKGEIIVVILNDQTTAVPFHLCMEDITFKDVIKPYSIITYQITH